MGINAEFVRLMLDLQGRRAGHLNVIELGAQDISASPSVVGRLVGGGDVHVASDLYRRLGYQDYVSIDASGHLGALTFDLNRDLRSHYGFAQTFDLVTNLGTLEHCFDQATAFRNMHNLCRDGGMMIHVLPAQGLVNHGFYNYHPRFIADLTAANGYVIEHLSFTVDFTPTLHPYSIEAFRALDTRDMMLYAVLTKARPGEFAPPFDGMFAAENVVGYSTEQTREQLQASEFQAYIKTTWANVLEAPNAVLHRKGLLARARQKLFGKGAVVR